MGWSPHLRGACPRLRPPPDTDTTVPGAVADVMLTPYRIAANEAHWRLSVTCVFEPRLSVGEPRGTCLGPSVVESLAYGLDQCPGGEGLLYEVDSWLQHTVLRDDIVGVSRHEEHLEPGSLP